MNRDIELVRAVSSVILADPYLLSAVKEAVVQATDRRFRSNPSIAQAIEKVTLENAIHWAQAMYDNPSHSVGPNLSDQVVGIAREGSRWGAEGTLRAAYRAGEQSMWSLWLSLAFSLSSDPEALRPALERASRSLAEWVEATSSALTDLVDQERRTSFGDEQIRRLELVNLVVAGAPISQHRWEQELRYPLAPPHLAVVLSASAPSVDRAAFVHAADVVSTVTESTSRLVVHASSSSLWLWVIPTVQISAPELEEIGTIDHGIRISIGPVGAGVDGFRRSHERAVDVQRLLIDHPTERVASYSDVAGVLLVAQEDQRLREFVHAMLGPLAPGPVEVRETLRAFIRERYNATRTAQVMFAHRNTVLQRVRRARGLLPVNLERNGAEVALALEALHWLRIETTRA